MEILLVPLVVIWIILVLGLVGYLFFSPAAIILHQVSAALSSVAIVKWVLWWPICIAAFFVLVTFAVFRANFHLDDVMGEDHPGWVPWVQMIEMMFLPWTGAIVYFLRGDKFTIVGLRLVMLNLAGPAFLFAVSYFILLIVNPASDLFKLFELDDNRIAKIIVLAIAVVFYMVFYAGMWLSGSMGDTFDQVTWHILAVIGGIGTWYDFITYNKKQKN